MTAPYRCNPTHRNGARHKSQWTIPLCEEEESFDIAHQMNWGNETVLWGLHRPFGAAVYLGVDQDHVTILFLAKFECKSASEVWHGYPVSHKRNRPPDNVLKLWLDENILPATKIAKIQVGKSCNL